MKKIGMIILLAIAGSYGTANAQQPAVIVSDKAGWHKIGETTVDFKKDSDEVVVLIADRFASIKFKVEDAPIDLISLTVYYESGDHQHIKITTPLKAAGESRVIDLNGGERSLKKIVFVYKTLPNRKDEKAHVEIWGLKTNSDNQDSKMNMQDNKMHHMKSDHVMMTDGKMVMMKDGKMMPMEKDMTMKNGTKCMTDGTCIMKDGKKMMMKDGDMMDMNGTMMMMKDDKMKDEKKKEY